jgi:hypothetical protein
MGLIDCYMVAMKKMNELFEEEKKDVVSPVLKDALMKLLNMFSRSSYTNINPFKYYVAKTLDLTTTQSHSCQPKNKRNPLVPFQCGPLLSQEYPSTILCPFLNCLPAKYKNIFPTSLIN